MYLGKLDIIKEEVWFSRKHSSIQAIKLLKYQVHIYSLSSQMGNFILLAEATLK